MYVTGLAFAITPSSTFACLNAFAPRVSKLGVARIATFFEPGSTASTTSALTSFRVHTTLWALGNLRFRCYSSTWCGAMPWSLVPLVAII